MSVDNVELVRRSIDAFNRRDLDAATRYSHPGQGKSSGATLDVEAGWVWTIRDGQAVRCDAYLHLDEALDAVGLRE
jgi:ketosteroid isomerase-like protein